MKIKCICHIPFTVLMLAMVTKLSFCEATKRPLATKMVHEFKLSSDLNSWAVSPDGHYIALGNRILSTTGLRPQFTLPIKQADVRSVAWSNDSRKILFCDSSNGYLYFVTRVEPAEHWIITKVRAKWDFGCFTMNGKTVVGLARARQIPNHRNNTDTYDSLVIGHLFGRSVKISKPLKTYDIDRFDLSYTGGGATFLPYNRGSVALVPERILVQSNGRIESAPKGLFVSDNIYDMYAGLVKRRWFIHAIQQTHSVGADLIQVWSYTELKLLSMDGKKVIPLGWNKHVMIGDFQVSETGCLWVRTVRPYGAASRHHVRLYEYRIVGLSSLP